MDKIIEFKKQREKFFSANQPYQTLPDLDPMECGQVMLQSYENYLAGHSVDNKFAPAQFKTAPRVGGDPEFFIKSETGGLVPSFEWLKTEPDSHDNFMIVALDNRKYNPQSVFFNEQKYNYLQTLDKSYHSHWYIHPDGIQLECGYLPSKCMEITSNYLRDLFIRTGISLKQSKLALDYVTSKDISLELASIVPLGCRPSFNAHDIDNNIHNKMPLKRFAGGHFHFTALAKLEQRSSDNVFLLDPLDIEIFNNNFSLTQISEETRRDNFNNIIKLMDATMGIWSVAVADKLDDPERRKHHYGMAGDYRLTNKTLEYRVPSNVVWQNSVTWHVMGMMGRYLVGSWLESMGYATTQQKLCDYMSTVQWGTVTDIINNTDGEAAREYWRANQEALRDLFSNCTALVDNWGKVNRLAQYGLDVIPADQKGWNVAQGSEYPPTLSRLAI